MPLDIDTLLGQRVRVAGHFAGVVRIEAVEDLDGAFEIRVRTEDGRLEETLLDARRSRTARSSRLASARS